MVLPFAEQTQIDVKSVEFLELDTEADDVRSRELGIQRFLKYNVTFHLTKRNLCKTLKVSVERKETSLCVFNMGTVYRLYNNHINAMHIGATRSPSGVPPSPAIYHTVANVLSVIHRQGFRDVTEARLFASLCAVSVNTVATARVHRDMDFREDVRTLTNDEFADVIGRLGYFMEPAQPAQPAPASAPVESSSAE